MVWLGWSLVLWSAVTTAFSLSMSVGSPQSWVVVRYSLIRVCENLLSKREEGRNVWGRSCYVDRGWLRSNKASRSYKCGWPGTSRFKRCRKIGARWFNGFGTLWARPDVGIGCVWWGFMHRGAVKWGFQCLTFLRRLHLRCHQSKQELQMTRGFGFFNYSSTYCALPHFVGTRIGFYSRN